MYEYKIAMNYEARCRMLMSAYACEGEGNRRNMCELAICRY